MKIKVKKRNLDAALQVVIIAVGSGDDTDIRTHYLVRYNVETDTTTILSQDGRRLFAEAPILECEVETDVTSGYDAFTVPGSRLRQWLSAIENGDEDLTLTSGDGVVKATAKRGTGKFGSLNPKDWPYWDVTYEESKEVARIRGTHLTNIFTYVKNFISDQETRSPGIVATESRDGILNATDSVGVALVCSPDLEKSTLRVHGKDIPSLVSFLGLQDDEVALREHDRCLFLRRDDGSMVGSTRWIQAFPILGGLEKKPDPSKPSKASFALNRAEVLGAIKYLSAFAKKDDRSLQFKYADGNMTLAMRSGSGSQDDEEQVLACVEHTGMDELKAEGHGVFTLDKEYVEVVANAFEQDAMFFRVEVTKKNGYVCFFHDRDGDSYFTVIVWVKNG
jgi:DNA polymerase III sliding clamp (beta) subunit (PCNA family)